MSLPKVHGYHLITKIRDGGLYAVYKATKLPHGKIVAIKLLLPQKAADRASIALVQREAKLALSLQHRYVIRSFGLVADTTDRPGIAMDYFESATLKQLVRGTEPITFEEALRILAMATESIEYLHGQGIIHKDVKPENFLVSPERKDFRLIDFSLAEKAGGLLKRLWPFAAGGKVEGTPSYISPEQIQGKPVSFRTDLYSLGVTCYEALTGEAPFVASDPKALLRLHVSGRPIAPRARNKRIPAELDRLIMSMLEKDPARRPEDAAAVLAVISEARKSSGVSAP